MHDGDVGGQRVMCIGESTHGSTGLPRRPLAVLAWQHRLTAAQAVRFSTSPTPQPPPCPTWFGCWVGVCITFFVCAYMFGLRPKTTCCVYDRVFVIVGGVGVRARVVL